MTLSRIGVWFDATDGSTRFVGWTRREKPRPLLTRAEHWSFVLLFAVGYLVPSLFIPLHPIGALLLLIVLNRRELARQAEDIRVQAEQFRSGRHGRRRHRNGPPPGSII